MPVMRRSAVSCLKIGYIICAIVAPFRYECYAALMDQHAVTKINTVNYYRVELVSISTSSPDEKRLLIHGGSTPVPIFDPNMSGLNFDTRPERAACFEIHAIVEVRWQFTVRLDNHPSSCHDIVSSSAASVSPCETEQHQARLGSYDDRRYENLRPRQFTLDCGLERHDLVLI